MKIEARNVSKVYAEASAPLTALADISFTIEDGDAVAIVGPSGCGKSTLLNLIGLLDRSSEGQVLLNGVNVSELDEDTASQHRSRDIGFVFQQPTLLPRYSVLQNTMLPLLYCQPRPARAARIEAGLKALDRFGLADRAESSPVKLSGGQQQRVALARALINEPQLVLADEPTGALDSKTGQMVIDDLLRINQSGTTLIIVTHDPNVAAQTGRIIRLQDGHIIEDQRQ